MKDKEIERKFLVKKLPRDYKRHPKKNVAQGYIGPLRLRGEYDLSTGVRSFCITVKKGSGRVRDQVESKIFFYQFVELAPAVENWIKKVRFFLPLGAYMAELDVFYGSLGGLIMAEVEFDSIEECDSFVPPKWFGREVTDDKRYTNHSLATYGIPEDSGV